MKQVYYTEEGTPYILKVATKNLDSQVLAAPQGFDMLVNFNGYALPPNQASVEIVTPRRIVPVMYSIAFVTQVGAVVTEAVDISTPYYAAVDGSGFLQSVQPCQGKMWPMIERIFFTDALHFVHALKYGQAVLADADFIETNLGGGLGLFFTDTQASALACRSQIITVPAGTYETNVTFLYFELQK